MTTQTSTSVGTNRRRKRPTVHENPLPPRSRIQGIGLLPDLSCKAPSWERSNARIMSIKFKNPPISELVIGVYFDREIPSLRSEHVGLFWGQVREDFPNIQQQPLVNAPVRQPFPQQIFISSESWMPRFWLEASDGSTLMQIQKNAFLFNWRKKETDYPH